ncbi:MAG: hypothetical protein M1818_002908 [Claussenomyces sp. TS43310]|nr:MAG: hypothetical protein M1818_002908 [Claussenomyces sp. TS43310]
MSVIKHEYTLNPVTALEFYVLPTGGCLLLVAEGLYLKIFDTKDSKLLACVKCFDAQTIHGIAVRTEEVLSDQDLKVVIWGGRSFILLDALQVRTIIAQETLSVVDRESHAADWILHAATGDCSDCLFITAHNAVLRVKLDQSGKASPLESLLPPSQAILYSAHIFWTSRVSFLVAGGSVFGEIEVIHWRDGRHTRLHTFIGHEGSVFGVQISPTLIGPHGNPTRLLASCSDDRTIRVWDIGSDTLAEDLPENAPQETQLFRETGFGDNKQASLRKRSADSLIAMAMGHASRIWHVKFLLSDNASSDIQAHVNVLSFGEDATCQQWSLESRTRTVDGVEKEYPKDLPAQQAVLAHCHTFAYHDGKHLWSTAVLSEHCGQARVATGGADGKVSLYAISPIYAPRGLLGGALPSGEEISKLWGSGAGTTVQSLVARDLLKDIPQLEDPMSEDLTPDMLQTPSLDTSLVAGAETPSKCQARRKNTKKVPKMAEDTFHKYAFITRDHLLATTSFGKVLLGSIRNPHDWEELKLPSSRHRDLKSYAVISAVPEYGVALLAGANGNIYCYVKDREVQEISRTSGKVAALLYVRDSGAAPSSLLATKLGGGEASLISFDVSGTSPVWVETKVLSLPSNFVTTSAGRLGDQLIIGSRDGHFAIYDIARHEVALREVFIQDGFNKDAVTTILPWSAKSERSLSYFIATSRNGSYSIFSITRPTKSMDFDEKQTILLVHHALPPFTNIEAAWFDDGNLYLSGFRSTSFIVWNETARTEVTNVQCGGTHRTYSYSAYPSASGAGDFAFTKASRLYLHSQPEPSHIVVKSGGHGREIKACAAFGSDLLATGAEDTTIRIWQYLPLEMDKPDSGPKLKCLGVIQKHAAGIQHLQWSEISSDEEASYLFSAGGTEEFYVWRVSRMPLVDIGVVLEATLTDYSTDRDLRIMSFDVTRLASPIPFGQALAATYQIALAYSDSTIRLFHYTKIGGFKRITHARYTASCLTQITLLPMLPFCYLTASTDGHVALWALPEMTSEYVPFTSSAHAPPSSHFPQMHRLSREKIHQSSIACLAVRTLNSEVCVVATGGDDNALCFTFVSNGRTNSRYTIPNAHAAAITGVGWIESKTENEARTGLWSIGGDQVLKKWVINIREKRSTTRAQVDISDLDGSVKNSVWEVVEVEAKEMRSGVADAAGLVSVRETPKASHVLVYGTGIEIFRS